MIPPPHIPQPRGSSASLLTIVLLASVAFVATARAAAPAPAPGPKPGPAAPAAGPGSDLFESKIRPLLTTRCFECHSHQAKKLKSDLYLDSRDGILTGGERGPAIVPGDAAKSRLIEAVSYTNPDLQMPPKGRLTADEIAALTQWINQGAPWPSGETSAQSKPKKPKFDLAQRKAEHWCWQPIGNPTPPRVRDEAWPLDDLDRFILAPLEAKNITPAPQADKRTLIRRAYFDLIGLPPSPAEVDAFLADTSAGAFAKVIDHLLASPHFGERWGRHWLDLVRYAETFGHEFDFPIRDAWRYRDYVIRAFNADVPYDQLVLEHVAGDLLPNPRLSPETKINESILATGFWFFHEQTHAPVDAKLHQADRIDNQIDTLTKTFLGLTVSCARCHDHKFDAISTKDYYALYGYLESSHMQYTWLDPGQKVAAAVAQLKKLRAELEAFSPPPVAAASQTPSATATLPAVFEDFQSPTWFQNWYPSGWAWQPAPGRADSGLLADKLPGVLRSRSFILQHTNIHFHVQGSGRLRVVVDGYRMDEFSGLLFGGLIQKVEAHGKPRWITISGALKKYLGQRAHIELIDDGPGSLIVDRIVTSDQPAPANFDAGWAASAPRSPDSEKILAEMSRLNAALPDHLDQATAMADGSGVDEHVFIRGSHKSPGDLVPRRFLEALASNKPGAATSVAGPGSGRLQLAQQIIDPANPLTARVIVNRLWHHLLGRGIAPTVDNLGVLGLRPTHPELLDHLATRFTSSGGSIKRMIRTIMLSRTYQMSSAPDASASGADPANDLFHRMNVKRLEGEIIRDELLALSGRLDPKPFGPSVPIYLTPFMDGRGRPKESGPMDGNGRRSIYIEVRRNFLSPMFLAFDTPQPVQTIGRRTVSNVPAQALILMNDPLIIQLADQWAQRELAFSPPPVAAKPGPATPVAGPGSVDHHLTHLYLTAFSHPPTADEITRAKKFLDATSQNWTDLCHVLINTKEFIFIY